MFIQVLQEQQHKTKSKQSQWVGNVLTPTYCNYGINSIGRDQGAFCNEVSGPSRTWWSHALQAVHYSDTANWHATLLLLGESGYHSAKSRLFAVLAAQWWNKIDIRTAETFTSPVADLKLIYSDCTLANEKKLLLFLNVALEAVQHIWWNQCTWSLILAIFGWKHLL